MTPQKDSFEATLLYIGVRIGAILPFVQEWKSTQDKVCIGPRLYLSEGEERLQNDFRRIAECVLRQGEMDDAKVIVKRTRRALQGMIGTQRKRVKAAG